MPAKPLTAPTATSNQPTSTIILTTGSTILIKAPAKTVFATILDTPTWSKWNTWTPSLTFPSNNSIRTPGSKGTLHTRMEAQNKTYDIPIEILQVEEGDGSDGSHILAWKSLLLSSWFARAERVQVVSPVDGEMCELRQWESMSGWGVYLLKWVLGIEKHLIEANVRYAEELKGFVEGVR